MLCANASAKQCSFVMVSHWCVCVFVARLRVCVCADTSMDACIRARLTICAYVHACMPWVALGSVTSWTCDKRDVRVTPHCTHAAHKRKQRVWHQRHQCELRAAHRVGPPPSTPCPLAPLQRPPSPTAGLTAAWCSYMGIKTMTGKRSVCYGATAQCGNSAVTLTPQP